MTESRSVQNLSGSFHRRKSKVPSQHATQPRSPEHRAAQPMGQSQEAKSKAVTGVDHCAGAGALTNNWHRAQSVSSPSWR